MKAQRMALAARLAELRPRRWHLVLAGFAVVLAAAVILVFFRTGEPPVEAGAAGEPLKLKLEFAFPAARR